MQIVTGVILAIHYVPTAELAFDSVSHIIRDVSNGWLLRYAHSNGASFIFIIIYCHITRGLYHQSFHNREGVWSSGVTIFIAISAAAFIGYVLPWGQISYWAAVVITNILGILPTAGIYIVSWIWGGFSVSSATLTRFYILHIVLPFVVAALAILHLWFLHTTGSKVPSKENGSIIENIRFNPYYTIKDAFIFIIFFTLYFCIISWYPNAISHPDNYVRANPLVTPEHIVPEWYFLPFYAILKCIPNKIFGAIIMAASIVILYTLPFISFSKLTLGGHKLIYIFAVYSFIWNILILGWVGSKSASTVFVAYSQDVFTPLYFIFFFVLAVVSYINIEKLGRDFN